MESLTFVEIDFALDAGSGTVGELESFRFTLPSDVVYFDSLPALERVSVTPAVVDPGVSMGERASISLQFRDFHYPLLGSAWDNGTFFGKLRALKRSLTGTPLRLIRGEVGQALRDMRTEHYVIDSLTRNSDSVTIVAKDLLKLATGSKAQAPEPSRGRVDTDIDDAVTALTLAPPGIGDEEYPASGLVNIGGSEICSFTRSGDVLTLTRAQSNTEAKSHDADELVQLVLEYASESPADIIYDLLANYVPGIDVDWLPLTEWQADIDSYIGRVYSAQIPTPTGVDVLINEVIEQAGLVMYWDAVQQVVRLKSLRPVTAPRTVNTDEFLKGSFSFTEQPDKRVSRVVTYFALRNPLAKLDDKSNYRGIEARIDTEAEIDSAYGQPAIREVFSRWIALNNRSAASRLNALLLARYRDPPRSFRFSLFRAASDPPELGAGVSLEHWALQDASGDIEPAPAQVVSLTHQDDRYDVKAEEVLFTSVDDPDAPDATRLLVIEVNTNNVNLRELHDAFYVEPESGNEVLCIINADATVGSTSIATPALDVGTWPVGVSITLRINGRIQGRGGDGGNPSNNGADGGTALYARYGITVENNGQIYGGGGGGAGSTFLGADAGGGGGAGTERGLAGFPSAFDGTADAGGAASFPSGSGGNPGSPGGDSGGDTPALGGAAGNAVDGNSYITYTAVGTLAGGLVN